MTHAIIESVSANRVTSGFTANILSREILRKSIHFMIALAPSLAALNRPLTLVLLAGGSLCYAAMERCRVSGIHIPVVSHITELVSRRRSRLELGPVTLGCGAFLALLCFPPAIAAVAIYALAFGDGLASLVGRAFGQHHPAFLHGKSLEGSAACFAAVFLAASIQYPPSTALTVAFAATLVEALPLKDYDNIAIPLVTGLVLSIVS
jgi:dolichol kinase